MNQETPEQSARSPEFMSYMFMGAFNLYLMTSVCLKTSLAISMSRLVTKTWQSIILATVTVLFGLFSIIEIFLGLFFCGLPTTMARKHDLAQCANWREMMAYYLAAAIFNAITDWIYTLVPAVAIWTSSLSLRTKLSASIITFVGGLSSVAAVYKISGSNAFTDLQNFDLANVTVIACAVLEMALGIIGTSMTTTHLPSLFSRQKTMSAGATTKTTSTSPEDDITMIKLSPIICQQKFADNAQPHSEAPGFEPEELALPTPNQRAGRFSWSRSFGAPGSSASVALPNNITLLIDDISDSEDEGCIPDKESKNVKQTYSNV